VYQHPGGENKRPSPAIVDASLRDAIPLAERAAYGDANSGLGETGLRGWGAWLCVFVVLTLLDRGPVRGADDETPPAGAFLFDTGVLSAQPLTAAALRAKSGWLQLPEDETEHAFRGDAVLLNDKLAAVLRTKGGGVDLFSITPAGGYEPRTTLIPLAAGGAAPSAASGLKIKILENNLGAVMLEASLATSDGTRMSLQCQLAVGQSILEIRPAAGVARLRLQMAPRYVVIPDFFGDDMVFTPSTLPRQRIILPAENFFLTPLADGAAMLMCVSSARVQNAEALITQTGERRSFAGCEVDCVPGKSLWVASLDGSWLWHEQPADLRADIVLDWQPPFPAKWRADFAGDEGFAQSWYFLGGQGTDEDIPIPAGQVCPCRIDGRRAVVHSQLVVRGPAGLPPHPLLVYPLDRSRATPLTAFCPTDVLRNTLGVGPCQYILQTEGLQSDTNPTPDNVMTWIEKQIVRKRHKKSAEEIRDLVQQMTQHVDHVAERIQRYAKLGHDVQQRCTEAEASSSLRAAAAALQPIAAGIQSEATAAEVTAVPQRVRGLAAQVAALTDQTDPLAECQRLGADLRTLGATQDRVLANSRMEARWLRARAKMLAADEPATATWTQRTQHLVDAALQDKR